MSKKKITIIRKRGERDWQFERSVIMPVQCYADERARAKALADQLGESVSAMIRRLVEQEHARVNRRRSA